ncbi:glycine/D-amino acid oxidase-like deaminating enzyme [Arthrobacter pigmenti]|uniref:Glycine/D-amino acid oxidase-like deaminating enzyme n=1 Tax=Arthrobacter pigmenti TaxID=271432 RepID=A0A846RT15_9MICC|nr:FAD-binding oxidoreductase [Arthrobacter pigmenti]NJC23672.1 glycine/D-amino acid oxidase-like deaminating enzyme [Arthrobacter pigmenti]
MSSTPDTPSSKNVAVIGGGILGVSTAVHLQREGASVVLITETELASGASGRSLSWLNSAGIRSDAYHALRVAGIDRYRTMFAANPHLEWLRFDGGVYWSDADSEASTLARHRYEKEHAYGSRLVDSARIPRVVPGIAADSVPGSAIYNPGDGWVSLPHLIEHLAAELVSRGGRIVTQAGKASVLVNDRRATGVSTTAGERYEADAVVVACGPSTPAVVGELGVRIDDGSPLSMLVTTEPLEHDIKAVLNTPRAATRPNPGGTLAIDHDWYVDQIIEGPDGNCSIPECAIQQLLDEASALLEGSPKLKAAEYKLGRKPIPGDGEPVFGELEKVPGCYVAFSHSGATVGLIAGELLADEIMSGRPHPMFRSFRPERFSERKLT